MGKVWSEMDQQLAIYMKAWHLSLEPSLPVAHSEPRCHAFLQGCFLCWV